MDPLEGGAERARIQNSRLFLAREHTDGLSFAADKEALDTYLGEVITPQLARWASVDEWLTYMFDNTYYDRRLQQLYGHDELVEFYSRARKEGYEFQTYFGALKFYNGYACRDRLDGQIIESVEDRLTTVALTLAGGQLALAHAYRKVLQSQAFMVTSPALRNLGRPGAAAQPISCYLIDVEDSTNAIQKAIATTIELIKCGGGVSLSLTNLRHTGDLVDGYSGRASGTMRVLKLLEAATNLVDQNGARQGAAAAYLNIHHPDIIAFLDAKKENADEAIRVRNVSLGITVSDYSFQAAKNNTTIPLISPRAVKEIYGKHLSQLDLADADRALLTDTRVIVGHVGARELFRRIAEVQLESGYPYLFFEGNANRNTPLSGRISFSNLCSEIMQPSFPSSINHELQYDEVGDDVLSGLGSLNVKAMLDEPELFDYRVRLSVRLLTSMVEGSQTPSSLSLTKAARLRRSIGIGQMNYYGYLCSRGIPYGSDEALEFLDAYLRAVTFSALSESNQLAIETGNSFDGFDDSLYANGEYLSKYTAEEFEPKTPFVRKLFTSGELPRPTREDWVRLDESIRAYGLYNQTLQAVAPTGSISYIVGASPSLDPPSAVIEARKEGSLGRVYVPAVYVNPADRSDAFDDAYDVGTEAIIATHAVATRHVDQGSAATLYFREPFTTRDLNRAHVLAWKSGLKSLYYVRLRQEVVAGTENPDSLAAFRARHRQSREASGRQRRNALPGAVPSCVRVRDTRR